MKSYLYCSNCLKLISKKEGRWVKRQVISEEGIIFEEWYQFVCFSCYKKLSKEVKENLVKQQELYLEE